MNITTEIIDDTLAYHFTRNKIDYMLVLRDDCIEVWKDNRQRRTRSMECFREGYGNNGKSMAKFIRDALSFIQA